MLNYMLRTIFKILLTACVINLCFMKASFCADPVVRMELYYQHEERGLNIWAGGKSIITDTTLLEKSTIKIDGFPAVRKIILVWSGEVSGKTDRVQTVQFAGPNGGQSVVSADRIYTARSAGSLYSCFADITSLYKGKGEYAVSGIQTDPLLGKKEKSPYSTGGFGIFIVYTSNNNKQVKRVIIKGGMVVVRPGEIHRLDVLEKGSSLIPETLVIAGGHGLKGNASANMINDVCISGQEDWDGSQGRYWDVDLFDIKGQEFMIREKGLTIGFDSLLQWIYPVAVAGIFKTGGE